MGNMLEDPIENYIMVSKVQSPLIMFTSSEDQLKDLMY